MIFEPSAPDRPSSSWVWKSIGEALDNVSTVERATRISRTEFGILAVG